MRPDFGKCVIERPRRGSSSPSAKARWYGKFVVDKEDGSIDYEGFVKLPSSRGDRVRHDSKDFTDVLGPIEGYLRSSCGRPWDDVFSELSQLLGKASWSLRHIMTAHLNVGVKTYLGVDGNVWHCGKRDIHQVGSYCCDFYVDPTTRILKRHNEISKRWYITGYGKSASHEKAPSTYELDVFQEGIDWYVRSQETGAWFLATLAEKRDIYPEIIRRRRYYPPSVSIESEPKPLPIPKYYLQYRHVTKYGGALYCFQRRKSLNKKEIKAMLARRDAKLRKKYPTYK